MAPTWPPSTQPLHQGKLKIQCLNTTWHPTALCDYINADLHIDVSTFCTPSRADMNCSLCPLWHLADSTVNQLHAQHSTQSCFLLCLPPTAPLLVRKLAQHMPRKIVVQSPATSTPGSASLQPALCTEGFSHVQTEIPLFQFVPSSNLISGHHQEQSGPIIFLTPPSRYSHAVIRSLLCSGQFRPSCPSPSSHEMLQALSIPAALCRTFSLSLLHWRAQNWAQDSRCGLPSGRTTFLDVLAALLLTDPGDPLAF